jgi:hypothetical protein
MVSISPAPITRDPNVTRRGPFAFDHCFPAWGWRRFSDHDDFCRRRLADNHGFTRSSLDGPASGVALRHHAPAEQPTSEAETGRLGRPEEFFFSEADAGILVHASKTLNENAGFRLDPKTLAVLRL